MQLKLFVIPIKNVSEAEAEMNGFLRGHRVLAVKFDRILASYETARCAQRNNNPPDQRQQQHWLPGCPAPSSTRESEDSPAAPATVPSPNPVVRGKDTQQPRPGVSSRAHSAKAPGLYFQNASTQSTP